MVMMDNPDMYGYEDNSDHEEYLWWKKNHPDDLEHLITCIQNDYVKTGIKVRRSLVKIYRYIRDNFCDQDQFID